MKAILVLDNMPDKCGHCRLAVMQRCYPICAVTGLECVEGARPTWCPLREPAAKIEVDVEHQNTPMDYYDWGFVNGWNNYRFQLIDEEEDYE